MLMQPAIGGWPGASEGAKRQPLNKAPRPTQARPSSAGKLNQGFPSPWRLMLGSCTDTVRLHTFFCAAETRVGRQSLTRFTMPSTRPATIGITSTLPCPLATL